MYALLDIGGTRSRISISHDGLSFVDPLIIDTPQDFHTAVDIIVSHVRQLAGDSSLSAVGGGVAGVFDRGHTALAYSPHLPNWVGKPLISTLIERFNCPVFLANDSTIVGVGEATAGAGRGHGIVAYLTISTGVGGARIVDGQPDLTSYDFEPGHQIIDASGSLRDNSVGGKGVDFEGLISGSAITDRYQKKPYEILDASFWEEMARLTSYGVYNTIVHWSPDVVVLGGSMMKEIGISHERVAYYLSLLPKVYPDLPEVLHSELGDVGGLHGALAFIHSHIG